MRTALVAVALLGALTTTPAYAGPIKPEAGPIKPEAGPIKPEAVGPKVQAQLSRLRALAEAHPDDFGAAYYDEASRTVVARTARGAKVKGVRTRPAALSWAQLTRLLDEAFTVELPEGAKVYSGAIDFEHERVVVEASSASPAVQAALRATIGPRVSVSPGSPVSTRSREADHSPFYGGAGIWKTNNSRHCTAGFAWRLGGGTPVLLTAGHCVPVGEASAWLSRYVKDEHSNALYAIGQAWGSTYADGIGTVVVNSRTQANTGDVGQIRIDSGKTSNGLIWTGPWNGTTYAKVTAQKPDPALNTANLCESGENGETCGWKITSTFGQYIDHDSGDYVKAVMTATKPGLSNCSMAGDSGAPVYVRNRTGVTAIGILSGGGSAGGNCTMFFTALKYAKGQLGGSLVVVV